MLRLKEIAARMDDCHPRTATRWWKKLDAACRRAGVERVAPDVTGHGPDKWHEATATRLLDLWRTWYSQRATTPRKFVDGKPAEDPKQTHFSFQNVLQNPVPGRSLGVRPVRPAKKSANHSAQPKQFPVSKVRGRAGVRSGQRARKP
jgi:hypothetical protein